MPRSFAIRQSNRAGSQLTDTNTTAAPANGSAHPMDQNNSRQPADYQQSGGLSSPHEPLESDPPSEQQLPEQPTNNGQYSSQVQAATPTSEYGMTPSSARAPQGQFPDYAQQQQRTPQYDVPYQQQPPTPGQQPPQQQQQPGQPPMAHAPNPNISGASPTYPQPQPPHYGGYPPPDMGHYQQPPMYPRPGEYPPPYAQQYGGYPPPMMHGRPGPPGGGVPLSTVYSFVPIPGTHQQKRPRRRYEEIERMYKCGWNGCEKAYGTLNHLNAHVTMQSHGIKRTPEEFKEIRKEWKQRKKEEDATRDKDGRDRPGPPNQQHESGGETPTSAGYSTGPRQLPPLGYAPAGGQPYAQPGVDGMQYSTPPVQGFNYSPYAPQPQGMYPPHSHAPGQNGHDPNEASHSDSGPGPQ